MNAADQSQTAPKWGDVTRHPDYQSADLDTRARIRSAFFDQVVRPMTPESILEETRNRFMAATEQDIAGGEQGASLGDAPPPASEPAPTSPESSAGTWSTLRDSEEFQQADWQTRQRMRGEFYDRRVRSRVPAGLRDEALGRFMTETEADVFGERRDPLADSPTLNAGHAGGLAEQRALAARDGRGSGADRWSPDAMSARDAADGEPSVLTDLGNLLAIGTDRAALNAREAVRKTLGEGVVNAIDRVDEWINGEESEALLSGRIERNESELTPETQEARQKAWIEEGEDGYRLGPAWGDWRSYAAGITESIPETAMTMAPSTVLAKGVYSWNLARGVAPKLAAKRAATTATVAGGLSEGLLGGGASSRGVAESIRGMDDETLRESEAVQALMAEGKSLEEAREILAEDASSQAFVTSGLVTGAFGGMGDRALAKILTGGPTSRLGAALRGAVGEGVFEEMPQEAGQQMSENMAVRRADPEVGPLDNVPNAAAGGLVLGAGMGAGIGGMAGGSQEADQEGEVTTSAQPGGEQPRVAESALTAASLIATPRTELGSADREARDSLVYGDGFKALRRLAEERGDTEAVAELDALSEEASDLLEEETLARTRGDSEAMGPVRERLGGVAQRFTRVTDRLRDQPDQGDGSAQSVETGRTEAEWEQAWRDQGMENPGENLPDTMIDIAPGRPEAGPQESTAQLSEAAITQARQVAAAQGGDALDQTLAGEVAEQMVPEQPAPAMAQQDATDGDLAMRLDAAATDLDQLSQAARDAGIETSSRQRRLSTVLDRAESALEAGNADQAERLYQRASTIAANLRQEIEGALVAPQPADDTAGGESAQVAPQGETPQLRSNGLPFATRQEAEASGRFRAHQRAGRRAQAVEVPGGWGVLGDNQNQRPEAGAGEAIPGQAGGQQREGMKAPESAAQAQRDTAYLPDNTPVETQFRVAELDELTPSNSPDGRINPAFPGELQPRDRTNANSRIQVRNIAARLNPERLGRSSDAGAGAPIIGNDGVVESGNGRTMAIAQAYRQGSAQSRAYRDFVRRQAQEMGLEADIDSMRQPVLVRERLSEMDRADFARRSNESQVAGMTAYEQARADADAMTADDLQAWSPDQGGDPLAASNRDFQRTFVQRLGNNEAARYTTRSGQAAPELGQRMSRAMFAKAYADPDMVEMVTEQGDQMRNLTAALQAAAPDLAIARETGSQEAAETIGTLNEAVRLVRRARQDGISVRELARQADAFSDPVPELTAQLAVMLSNNMRSRAKLESALTFIAQDVRRRAETARNGALFEDTTTSEDAIREGFQPTQDAVSEGQRAPTADVSGGARQGERQPAQGREAGVAEGAQAGQQAEPVDADPLLATYDEQELIERDQAKQQAQQAEADQRRQEEQRAQADAEVDDFRLAGSDREADVMAAGGQQDLMGAQPQQSDSAAQGVTVNEQQGKRPWAPYITIETDVDNQADTLQIMGKVDRAMDGADVTITVKDSAGNALEGENGEAIVAPISGSEYALEEPLDISALKAGALSIEVITTDEKGGELKGEKNDATIRPQSDRRRGQTMDGAEGRRGAPPRTSLADMPDAIIHAPLSAERESPDYRAAKLGDPDAAMRYVESLLTVAELRRMREAIGDRQPIAVPVRAQEAEGRNKIPSAYASVLAETLGLEVDAGIVQVNRAQRSQLDGMERLFVQPEFDGPVTEGREYLIVDDTLTQGGTVAALKGHIEAGGGRAILAGALTGKQYSATLSPDPALLETVRERFGDLEADFIETQGYGYDQLTQSEARYIANLTSKADAFRDRITAGRDVARRAEDGGARRPEPEGSAAQGRPQAVTPPASSASGRDQDPQFAFAGERAETADTRSLGAARERIERGDDPETVRRETGWFQGPDERWRFEINDSDARFLPFANGTAGELWTESLDRVLDHPALFAAYPGLRELDVVSARGMGNRRGQFRARNGEIMLNAERDPMEQFSTLLHEIQHGIQHMEGFATGGDPADYRLPPLREKWLKDRVHALGRESAQHAAELLERHKAGEITLEDVQQGIQQYAAEIGLTELRRQLNEGNERGAFRHYQRLAGEVEARNVQARQGMSAAERRTASPLETADVPRSEVVVVFNGTPLEQAPPPANADPALPPNGAPYVSEVAQRLAEHPVLAGVRAVQSVTELPARVVATMEAQGIDAGQVAGVYDPTTGESFVVADNLMDAEEGVRRAVHEAVGHQGIRGVLGSDLDRVMMEVYRSYMGSEAGRAAIRQLRETYPFLDVTTREGRLGLAEELVARVVEESDGRPALRERVMSAIRRALRAVFPGVAWTDGDVRVLGDRARRYMETQQSLQKAGASDPADTLGLRSVVRGEGREPGLALEEAQHVVDEFVGGFRGDLPLEVRVASTQEELYGPQATVARVGRIKGAYHPARGVMTVVAGNANGKRDIQRTLRHEILGHYGLNTFSQREKRALLDRILETQDAPSMAGVWDEVRRNYADASPDLQAEEVFAHVAEVERGALGEAWDRVLAFLQRILRRVGLIKQPVSRRELHDLARQMGESMREGRRTQQTFPASDQAQFSREAPRSDEGIRFSLKSEQTPSVAGPYGPNDSTGFALPDEGPWDVVLRRGADKMRPLLRLRRAIRQAGGTIEEEADPYLTEELYHGRLEHDLEGLRREYVEPLAEGLAKAGISQADLDDYLYALHAPERNAVVAERNPNDESLQDGGSGMTNEDAAAVIDKVERSGKRADYDRLAKIVHDITAMRRDAIRDGGLETDDVLDAWQATYEHYVPLKGHANDEPEAPRIGKGFQITGRESFMVKGRRTRAASPSTQAIVDANLALIRRRKNEVGNAFLSLVTDHPNPALWEVFTDDNPDAETATVRVTDPESGEKRWEVRERPVQMGRDDRYFKTKRAGRTYYIKVKDQRLLNAMRNVGPESNGWLIRTAGAATRVMSSLVTSLNPEFLVTNFERDIQTALLNVGAEQTRDDGKIKGQRILWDTARDVRPAMRAAWRGLNHSKASTDPRLQEWDRWFQEFIEDGAKTGYFDMKDVDAQAKEIAAMVRRADGTTLGHMRRFSRKTADLVENVNGAVENAVRLSAYANARRNGLSRRQAASLAKNLTVNFNRRGEVGTALNAAYMFANASIQGTMNFARVMVTLKNTPEGRSPMNVWARMNLGQKIGMGMASGAFALALLNRWLSDEDDDGVLFYDKIPDHVKERHYVLMTGWATGNPEDYIKIPLPYGYNVFAVAGTHMESVIAGTESPAEAAKNLGLAVVGSFSPIGWEDSESVSGVAAKNLTPTLVRSLTQLGWNEDFAARPIYKENFPFGAPKPESSLSFRSTPEAYKTLSRVLNDITGGTDNIPGKVDINPDVIQHLVNYYGGGAWGFAEKTGDFVVRSIAGEEVENYRVPFTGRVLGNVTPYPDQQQFYERRDQLWQIREEADSLKGREGMRYRIDHRDELRLFEQAKATADRLTELRKNKDSIEANERLSDAARKVRVERIERAMERRVDRFNRLYNEALAPELVAE